MFETSILADIVVIVVVVAILLLGRRPLALLLALSCRNAEAFPGKGDLLPGHALLLLLGGDVAMFF